VIGFGFAAGTELLHALVGIEWSGWFVWIENYSGILRPTTWPPSTYVLPLAMTWIYWLTRRNAVLSPNLFAVGMGVVTLALFALSFRLPNYADTGILGIQRPTQIPLLLLWLGVIAVYWRKRHEHRLFEGLALMGVLLFLSDLCMLYSTSPHEKFTMMAHAGKLIAYAMLHVLQMRIAAEDSQARDESELAYLEEHERLNLALAEINKLALYDNLTGLANRRLLNDRLEQILSARKRSGRYAALIFIDLDNFKPLNDTYGHTVGDFLLIAAAQRITDCVRETDTVARFGGDEFVVALGDLVLDDAESTSQASIIAEKIRFSLAETYQLVIKHNGDEDVIVEHHCTSSIGVVVFNDYQLSLDDVLKRADAAMYQAKEAGRNMIRMYKPRN
jgi:diguanylate cyclase (GGDEF)-like protein